MKLRDATLQVTKKTVSHILFPHSHTLTLLPSFPQNASPLFLPKRLWKCASIISFRKYNRKLVLPVIYLFHYDSSKSTFFMLNMTLTFSWVQFLSNKWEFFVSWYRKITKTSFFLGSWKNHIQVSYGEIRVHTSDRRMINEYIWVTYEWHTSTYEWHTSDIQVHTSDMRMTYEYIRVTYEWHTSAYEWHTNVIRTHTSDIRMTCECIRGIYGWHTSTYA